MHSSLKLTELPSGRSFTWPADEIPPEHLWAYDHLIEHDCGSISCGKSIYQIVNDYRFGVTGDQHPAGRGVYS